MDCVLRPEAFELESILKQRKYRSKLYKKLNNLRSISSDIYEKIHQLEQKETSRTIEFKVNRLTIEFKVNRLKILNLFQHLNSIEKKISKLEYEINFPHMVNF